MKDAQKPDHVSLTVLIDRLKDGQFVIPDFQREVEWLPADVRDLMRSIFLDYYIGTLLLWTERAQNLQALACEPIYGVTAGGKPAYIVLDGQQRLTALYYALVAPNKPYPGRANRYLFYIKVDKFVEEAYDDAFAYDWTQYMLAVTRTEEYQFKNHIFPLSVVGKGGWALPNWAQKYESYWRNKAQEVAADGDHAAREEAEAAGGQRSLIRRTSQRHHREVSSLVHRARSRSRTREGVRHLHSDKQQGPATRCL